MGQYGLFVKSPIGMFVFSDVGELLHFRLFNRNPEKAVSEYMAASEGSLKDIRMELIDSDSGYTFMRKNLREYSKNLGFVESDSELNEFLSDFCYALSKKKMEGSIGRDKIIVQATNALEDISRAINLFHERLYEWFSLHYPELRNTKDLPERIITHGRRESFPEFKHSVGADINENDETIFIEFASLLQNMMEEKERMEAYIKTSVKEIAPTTSSLLDPIFTAKLISHAGSLEKLARMPASTIQLLGAEKALFRHLHNKGKSPKYGIIFTTHYVQNAPADKKGKAARLLSSKLMMAARIDYYSGRYEERLVKELKEEMKNL